MKNEKSGLLKLAAVLLAGMAIGAALKHFLDRPQTRSMPSGRNYEESTLKEEEEEDANEDPEFNNPV